MSKSPNIASKRFGMLIAVEPVGLNKSGRMMWRCLCDCGTEFLVKANAIMTGNTKSCGCLKKNRPKVHGKRPTELYQCWLDMKKRCDNPKAVGYMNYGGRGISVCDEWGRSYITFRDFALANGWSKELQIDRIDVNGNYEPSNIRFVDKITQMNNCRSNVIVLHGNTEYTVAQLSRKIGVSIKILRKMGKKRCS